MERKEGWEGRVRNGKQEEEGSIRICEEGEEGEEGRLRKEG